MPDVGPDQAEQHPDRGGLAGAVGAEEPVDGAVGNGEVDRVDGDLAGAEPFRERGAFNGEVAVWAVAHLPAVDAVATSCVPLTEPMKTRPSLVRSTENSAVCSSLPLPKPP